MIIFLDIDGVFNNLGTMLALGSPSRHWDRVAAGLVYKLCTEAPANIVVSSSWRVGRTVEELAELLDRLGKRGLGKFVIGKTPSTGFIRGEEIDLWRKTNNNDEQYVIIDDDSDMLEEQMPNFIKTKFISGFNAYHYILAMKILNPTHPDASDLEKYLTWEHEQQQKLKES